MQTPPAPTPRNRQTSCLHTTKAPRAPRQVPQGLLRREPAAQEPWAGFPARPSARAQHLRWGSPDARAAPRAHAERPPGPPLSTAPPQRAGHRDSRPPTCSAASALGRSGAADRYFYCLGGSARGTWELGSTPALRATPLGSAPSRAPAFLFLLLSAQAPARHVSRAARLPGWLGSRRPPHPRPGAARRPRCRSPRVLASVHTYSCARAACLASFRPSVLPACSLCQPRLPAPGSALRSCPRPPPLRGLGRPLPMRLG